MEEPIVVLKNVWKRYLRAGWVLRGIDLDLAPGTMASLIGSNGSGKTTLLRIIAGLTKPSKGEVRIAGHNPASLIAKSVLGVVLDKPLLYRELTVRENLAYYSSLYGVDLDIEDYWVVELIGLNKYLDRRVEELSYGWKRRADIARALLHSPRVILVDEVFTGLDEEGVKALSALFDELVGKGSTVLVASPQKSAVKHLKTDYVFYLKDGRLSMKTL